MLAQAEIADADIRKIGEIVHAWRGDGETDAVYADVPGFCRSVALDEIAGHAHVLTPSRYVGSEAIERDEEGFMEKMRKLTERLGEQMAKGRELDMLIRRDLEGLGYEL